MTERLTIALAQMNQRVGDLHANADAILAMRRQGERRRLAAGPGAATGRLSARGSGAEARLPARNRGRRRAPGRRYRRARPGTWSSARSWCARARPTTPLIVADEGRELYVTLKRELPNYGTFDEKRVFSSGPLPEPFTFKGVRIGIPDLRGSVAGGRVAPPGRARRRDSAQPQRQPLRDRQGRSAPAPVQRPLEGGRPAAGLSQPRRRAGRARVRRQLDGVQRRRHHASSRCATGKSNFSLTEWAQGRGRPLVVRDQRSPTSSRPIPRTSTSRWSSPCATTSPATAFRA